MTNQSSPYKLPEGWIEQDNKLKKTFFFNSFADAISWMVKASYIIDKHNHHPEWTNVYNRVHVTLCTHDAGDVVTAKDFRLAEALNLIGFN